MAEAIIGVPQSSDIGPILFVIYVTELPSHVSAGDVELIAPRNRHNILQKSLKIGASRSKESWTSTPAKSERLPIGNSPHFVTYILPSHYPPNTQNIPTVSTTNNLGIVLNTRLTAEDNVVKLRIKPVGCWFT